MLKKVFEERLIQRNVHLGVLSKKIKTQKSMCDMILIFKKENLSA